MTVSYLVRYLVSPYYDGLKAVIQRHSGFLRENYFQYKVYLFGAILILILIKYVKMYLFQTKMV